MDYSWHSYLREVSVESVWLTVKRRHLFFIIIIIVIIITIPLGKKPMLGYI
jgi:hypothetical protein